MKIILLDNNSWLDGTKEPIEESFDAAIKSLEAWDGLKAEIEELPSGLAYYIKGTSVLPAVEKGSLRELIDEHLRRIEE